MGKMDVLIARIKTEFKTQLDAWRFLEEKRIARFITRNEQILLFEIAKLSISEG